MAYSRTDEHVGEWAVTLGGRSREELFGELARVIARAAGRPVGPAGSWELVSVESPDATALLVAWANELVGRSEIAHRAYDEVRAPRIGETPGGLRLDAEVRGRAVPAWRSPIKAATYHDAIVEGRGRRWRARILFDV